MSGGIVGPLKGKMGPKNMRRCIILHVHPSYICFNICNITVFIINQLLLALKSDFLFKYFLKYSFLDLTVLILI